MDTTHYPLVSWRSIFAGFFVSLLVYAILVTLGVAIGGLSLVNVIQANDGESGLAIGGGLWLLVSGVIALFTGSYFAGRISNFITSRIGAAQGLVISSLFFGTMALQAGLTLGFIGSGVGSAVGGAGSLARDVISDPQVQNSLEQVIADRANLRSDPEVVLKGLATRLARGDRDSARNYLTYQTGMTLDEADQRLLAIESDFKVRLDQAGISAARFLSGLGWSLFTLLLLGAAFAGLGGGLGSRNNVRHPWSEEVPTLAELKSAYQS